MISYGLPRRDVIQVVCGSFDELPENEKDGTIGKVRTDGGEEVYVCWDGAWKAVSEGSSDQGDVPVEMMIFEVEHGEAALVGISEDYVVPEEGYSLVVPAEYQGAPVLYIGIQAGAQGSPYMGCRELLAASVVSVDTVAFSGCYTLLSVSLPAAVEIGMQAFYNCVSLATVSLPSSSIINRNAFTGCMGAERVEFGPLTVADSNSFVNWFFREDGTPLPASAANLANKTFTTADGTLVVGNPVM